MSAGVSSLERIEAILRNEAMYELARLVPQKDDGPGRKRTYPDYMLLVFDALISVYGSSRKAEAELSHAHTWRYLRKLVKRLHPNDVTMHLPSRPYRRHHYEYGRNRYLTDPEVLQRLQEMHRKLAAAQANELGLLNEHGKGTWTHPELDRLIYADGKVVAPLYKGLPGATRVDPTTGEIKPVRFEADADLHFQGDGETAYGTKFVLTAVRSSIEVHGRVILDVGWVAAKGGEAKTAMQSFRDVAPLVPGAQGVIYDTALRGVHHQELMRDLGWLSINRVTAAQLVKRDGKVRKRVEKSVHIEDKKINGKTVHLFALGGAVGVSELNALGEPVFTELKRTRTHRKADKAGTYRFYNEYELPTGGNVMVRLDTTDEDRERGFNRTENVRPIAPSDPDFMRIYRRRNDAESINRALDDSMWLGRAHSKGHERQLVNLLGYALMVNGLALMQHRERQRVELLPTG